jgi:hypothetical protein
MNLRPPQLAVLLVGVWGTPALAQSNAIAEQTVQLREYGGLGDFEARCKSKITVSIDDKTFSKALPEHADKLGNLYRHCSKPIRALTEWCSSGYDGNIKQQVSSYVCKYDPDERTMALDDGVLTLTTDWTSEPNDWSKNALGSVVMDGAFTLAQMALIRDNTNRIEDAMADMSRRCEGDVKWTVDWPSFREELTKRIGKTDLPAIWQQCSAPLVALEALCTNDQASLMLDQVNAFACHFDEDVPANMVLDGTTLSLTSNFSAGGLKEWASHLVGDTLRDGDFTVRQAAFMRDEDAHFSDLYSKRVNGKCDTNVAGSIDWTSFVGEVDKRLSNEEKTSIYASCGVPLDRLADVCETDPDNKVKPMVNAYTCTHGGDGKAELTLSDGALAYAVDFSAEDTYGAVDRFLIRMGVIKKRPAPKKLSPKDLANIRRILGEGANIQQCYKGCAARCSTQACKNQCRAGCN